MVSLCASSKVVKVSPRQAAGLVRRCRAVWVALPGCLVLRVTRKAAREMLTRARERGRKVVDLILVDGAVQIIDVPL